MSITRPRCAKLHILFLKSAYLEMHFEQVERMGDACGAGRGQTTEVPPTDALGLLRVLRHGCEGGLTEEMRAEVLLRRCRVPMTNP